MGKPKKREGSIKKRILIAVLVLAFIAVAAFLLIKFVFVDPDLSQPYKLTYSISQEKYEESDIETASVFLYTNSLDNIDKIYLLNSVHRAYLDRIASVGDSWHNADKMLYATNNLVDQNKVEKKIKNLEKIKENVDLTKNSLLDYCKEQVLAYKNSTTEYSRAADYIQTFGKRYVDYIKSLRDYENALTQIIETSAVESSYVNELTIFTIQLNNKVLENQVEILSKVFNTDEEITITNSAFYMFDTKIVPRLMFELKSDAIEVFVNNKAQTLEQIQQIKNYSFLNEWIKVFNTNQEQAFVNTLDQQEFKNVSVFIHKFYQDVKLAEVA